jgi:hypothetical protein
MNLYTLNDDSLKALSDFLPSSFNISATSHDGSKFLGWKFPRSVTVRGLEQIRNFQFTCARVDTSRLIEVSFVLGVEDRLALCESNTDPLDVQIGWVPPSVKTLTIKNFPGCDIVVPNGVEFLSIDYGNIKNLVIPDTVQRLDLGPNFNGSITRFPSGLNNLSVLGWSDDDHVAPVLPETVHEVYIGMLIPISFLSWPDSLQKLTIELGGGQFAQHVDPLPHVEFIQIPEPEWDVPEWDDHVIPPEFMNDENMDEYHW